jgi:hypothetical protein
MSNRCADRQILDPHLAEPFQGLALTPFPTSGGHTVSDDTIPASCLVGGRTTYAKEIFEFPPQSRCDFARVRWDLGTFPYSKSGIFEGNNFYTPRGSYFPHRSHHNCICNREGAEIPADRLPNGCKTENLVGYKRVVPSSSWVKREPIPHFPNYPYKAGALTSA